MKLIWPQVVLDAIAIRVPQAFPELCMWQHAMIRMEVAVEALQFARFVPVLNQRTEMSWLLPLKALQLPENMLNLGDARSILRRNGWPEIEKDWTEMARLRTLLRKRSNVPLAGHALSTSLR